MDNMRNENEAFKKVCDVLWYCGNVLFFVNFVLLNRNCLVTN